MDSSAAAWMRIAVEIVACSVMVLGLVGVFIERWRSKRGVDAPTIQLLAVTQVLPIILILALEDILSGQTAAALLGVVVGYVLSGIPRNQTPNPK
jgi:hypothetical protein